MKRANVSAKRPNVSESTCGRRTICRRVSRGTSRRGPRVLGSRVFFAVGFLSTGSTALRGADVHGGALVRRGVAPVLGEHVVEQVVDGDGTDEPAVLVDHG